MLFRRLHLQLTALCALITITILTIFTFLYLSVSEHTLRNNLAFSFAHDFDTLVNSLEQQPTLTYSFLLRMEQTNDYMIFLWDNGNPLAFNRIDSHAPYAALAQNLYADYLADAASPESASSSVLLSLDANWNAGIGYLYTGQMNAVEKNLARQKKSGLVLLLLSPNTAFRTRILQQRILFFLLSLAGGLFLTLAAWLFTGRMLRPLQENQERQLAFISGASHELRTPLAVILSSVEARPPHFEETVKSEALRMGRLVEDLLTISRLDSLRLTKRGNAARNALTELKRPESALPESELLEPDTFLTTFYEQTETYATSCGRKLRLELPDETVPRIRADRDRLWQLFEILLQNALNYTEPDGVITLSLRTDSRSGTVCLRIADNGTGIPDAEKDKIFERFYRVDSAHHSKNHFGLGLSIAREIMHLHRGQIHVTDTPGGGATFTCIFPACR
ncbi:MAG: HAMP domain-containing histidine kinase [Muribaculum sp.]|nr:HAMP domain-containing histidine kinase [Muribaculum sp.]